MTERSSTVKFDFLDAGKTYIATIYADGKTADYKTNPQSYEIKKVLVNKSSKLVQRSVVAGGFAISVMETTDVNELKGLKFLK